MRKDALAVLGFISLLLSGITPAQEQPATTDGAIVTIDFSQQNGTVRHLNGANLGPPLAVQNSGMNLNELYKALRIPYARLHDVPLDNPGMRLVDIQHIFGNWNADAGDPKNYYFEQTDDYIRNCRAVGSDVIYRLGTSIEHSANRYYAKPPLDYQKWAEVSLNIIRHYNDGWAEGHHWNIRYWEIWNEPHGRQMWAGGADEDYFRLYVTASKQIKARFPDLKVGGPATAMLDEKFIVPFLKYCREHDAPLDFLSWHYYGADLNSIAAQPARAREWLDRFDFHDCELHLNEWHYFPFNWRNLAIDPKYRREVFDGPDGCNGIDAAAYITAVLTAWQDTPLTMGNYYTASGVWGFGLFPVNYAIPYKTYYGMLAFAQVLDHPIRVKAETNDQSVKVLAGIKSSGAKVILISAYKSDTKQILLDMKDLDTTNMTVKKIDGKNDLVAVDAKASSGHLVLEKSPGSCVFLIVTK